MEISPVNLPNNIEALKALLIKEREQRQSEKCEIENTLERAKNKITYLEQMLSYFQRRRFSSSSEQWPGQRIIFNEPEVDVTEVEAVRAKIEAHERRRPVRRPLPADLPRIEHVYELSEEERHCECGGRLEEFGEEVSEQLDVIPVRLQVLRHRRKKYSCPCCKCGVMTAKMPRQPLPKTNASSGLLSYVATAKYVDHLPLYRQEEIFRRLGIDMPRATLARWMIDLGELLRPLYNLMHDDLLEGPVLLMDETPVQVLKGSGKKPTADNFMWVRCRAGPEKKVVLFHYDPTRSAACARQLLSGYRGILMTDGYEAYDGIVASRGDLIHCGCWDHARRRFFDAVKAEGSQSTPTLAQVGLSFIQNLYSIERDVKESDACERQAARQQRSRPTLDELRRWLDRVINTVPPKSLTGKALHYLNDQWEKLARYIDHGEIPISNIMAENAIRPFALGRKNWLFSDTRAGAESSSILFSVIETAKANGREPYEYLNKVIARLPQLTTADEITKLLPY